MAYRYITILYRYKCSFTDYSWILIYNFPIILGTQRSYPWPFREIFLPSSEIISEIGHTKLPEMAYTSKTSTIIESLMNFMCLNIKFDSK